MFLGLLLVLSGCLKYDLTLVVSDDDKMDGTLIVAVAREFAAGQDILGQTGDVTTSEGTVTKEAYEDADYIGSRYVLSGVPISEIDSLSNDSSTQFSLTREGQEYVLDASINFNLSTTDAVPTSARFTAMVSVTFPGSVTESNGTIDGNTVVWPELKPDAENSLTARASAISNGQAASPDQSGTAWWIWAIGGVGVLLVVLVIIALVVRKRRAAKAAQAASATGVWPGPQQGPVGEYPGYAPATEHAQESGYYDSGVAEGYGSFYGTYGETPSGSADYPSGRTTGDTYRGPPGTAPAPQPGYPQPGNPPGGNSGQTVVGYPDPSPPAQGWVVPPPS